MSDHEVLRALIDIAGVRARLAAGEDADHSWVAQWYLAACAELEEAFTRGRATQEGLGVVRDEIHAMLASVPGLQLAISGESGAPVQDLDLVAMSLGDAAPRLLTDVDAPLADRLQAMLRDALPPSDGGAAGSSFEVLHATSWEGSFVVVRGGDWYCSVRIHESGDVADSRLAGLVADVVRKVA